MASNNSNTPLKRLADRFNDRAQESSRSTSNSPIACGVRQEIRMVLLGKTGSGKSTLGNLLLGCPFNTDKFPTGDSAFSVTKECSKEQITLDDNELVIVDTPGFCDTNAKTPEERKKLVTGITNTILELKPGPHIFLILLPRGRYTKEELECLETAEKLFGGNIFKYSVVVFPKKDHFRKETIDQYLVKTPPELKSFLEKCDNRYVSINADPESPEERKAMRDEVMNMIKKTISQNNFAPFTNKLFKEVTDRSKMNKEGVGRFRSSTSEYDEETLNEIYAVVEEHVSAVLDKK